MAAQIEPTETRMKTRADRSTRFGLTLALMPLLLLPACFPGRKVLTMEVHQNDQLVLRTVFHAPDSESPAKLWRYASQEPSHSEAEVLRVKPDPGDPLHATLKGTIRIRILHTTTLQTTALLTDLELVRRAADTPKWFLPESEVERATRAMQPVVTSRFTLLGLPPSVLVVGLVILTAMAAFIIGVRHWRSAAGKAATIVSGLILIVFAIVIFCVLLTVSSGSMG
jgi:hypothetical protein